MSRLTQLALGKRSVTLLLTAALFVAGVITWGGLKQELVPDVSFPIVTIIAPFPGAGAADVTEQVTKPLEQAVSGIAGIDSIQSTSANSFGLVVAQFNYGVNLDNAVKTIQDNLRKAGLPEGVTPSVQAFNFNAAPVVIASLSARAAQTSSVSPRSRGRSSCRSSSPCRGSPQRTSPAERRAVS
jgi:HAE1 family hydrophobic/amphiphilic exporter-1